MRDKQTTTSEDRATQLLICKALSLAIVHFSRDCENLSFTVNHLLYCMRSFHLEAAHVSNSATKSQLGKNLKQRTIGKMEIL